MTVKDIAWLAGIIEGEGAVHDGGFGTSKYRSPTISIQMADKDVVAHIATLFQRKVYGPYDRINRKQCKSIYRASVHGRDAIGVMLTVFPFLGERRRSRIVGVVSRWRANPRNRGSYRRR